MHALVEDKLILLSKAGCAIVKNRYHDDRSDEVTDTSDVSAAVNSD